MEKLVEKLMNEIATEKPSLDFTSNLMKQINVVSKSKSTTYQPLISKTGWSLIALALLALFGFVILLINERWKVGTD